jgi:hypothetical protein
MTPMPHIDLNCLRCKQPMEQGYMIDRGHGNAKHVANWVEGEPDLRWYGIKTRGHHQIPVAAYRCTTCGAVELRAVDEG